MDHGLGPFKGRSFLVVGFDEFVNRLSQLSRPSIRKHFEKHFTARRMALDYVAAYRSLMEVQEPRIKLVSSAE